MAESRKRNVNEIERIQTDERDVQEVPDSNEDLIVDSENPAKRHQSQNYVTTKTDQVSAATPSVTDQVDSISKNEVESTTKESKDLPVLEKEERTNDRDSVNHVDQVPNTKEEQAPTSTEQQAPPVPVRKSVSSTIAREHQHHHQHQVVPRKEPTIFNVRPVDDITMYIADVIGKHLQTQYVEIEAKLGVFIDKQSGKRINLGAPTEMILIGMEGRVRFESNMTRQQHENYNKRLNELVSSSGLPGRERIKYQHTYETDTYYQVGRFEKWRVTTDQRTGKVVPDGIIEKQRITDINIHIPKQPLDYRISINVELPRTMPTTAPGYTRHKDRVSYQHGGIQFDLTQVKSDHEKEEPRHELELEIIDPLVFAREKSKMDRRESSQYYEMVESFINNVRMLSRKAIKLGNHYQ
ncbi:CYTH-like domain-containing protein [Phascolomyces articulosus]|uniref:mRNA-capping enzyme subunit beta n=1 Tax=Phascolomyces articulosus TaxID=60185 RepID=A0AAD5K7J2_9FUNG|nr:CYTH-like domain-containing protein [Phascolomyces articulosus]